MHAVMCWSLVCFQLSDDNGFIFFSLFSSKVVTYLMRGKYYSLVWSLSFFAFLQVQLMSAGNSDSAERFGFMCFSPYFFCLCISKTFYDYLNGVSRL